MKGLQQPMAGRKRQKRPDMAMEGNLSGDESAEEIINKNLNQNNKMQNSFGPMSFDGHEAGEMGHPKHMSKKHKLN